MTTTGKKITDFTSLTSIADSDIMLTVDVSDTTSSPEGTTKKVLFSEIKGDITSGLNISNWNIAFNWGNHASGGYITSETDPVFSAHPTSDITITEIGQWNAAYGWGNHAVQGYLQSISTQSINSLSDVDTTGVATNNVLKWSGTSWIPGTVAGGGGTTINELNDVGDVDLTVAPTANQVLKYDIASSKWKAGDDLNSGGLTNLSVNVASAGINNLAYNNTTGVFTYTPPDLSSYLQNIVEDTSPQLSGNLDLDGNNITGAGDINISGDLKGDTVRLTNNSTTPGSGNRREIKVIGQLPHFYDGTDWRPFFLIDAPTQIPADTDWDNVMIRSTFDSDITDVKYNVTPDALFSSSSSANASAVSVVSAPVKVGAKSLKINSQAAVQSRLEYPLANNYDFTGAWTMEAWVYLDGSSWSTTAQSIFSGDGSNGDFALLVRKSSNSGSNAVFSWYNSQNAASAGQYGETISSFAEGNIVGAWCHVALVRSASDGLIKLYANGSQVGNNIEDFNITQPEFFNLGGMYGNTYTRNFDGFLDDVRISKSTRYTTSFTAPATQLPVSGSTTQLLPPQADKKGEIELDSTSPTFKGSPGVTMTRTGPGVYRLTFASSYSAADDYYVMAQGMDHSGGAASYITITRSTAHVDISVKKQADDSALDDGSVGVQIINNT